MENIFYHPHPVTSQKRQQQNGHRPLVIWMTGLSGSGKSTLSGLVEERLHQQGVRTYLLDGDNLRKGLNRDLGFNDEDRKENIRRIAEVAMLFADGGMVVFTAFISPFKHERERAKKMIGDDLFVEVYLRCPLDVCEDRDVKGLYKKARSGEIKEFTGVNSPYEVPDSADLIIDTELYSIEENVGILTSFLQSKLNINNVLI